MTPTDTKSETPRTDAVREKLQSPDCELDELCAVYQHGYDLERELNQNKALLERAMERVRNSILSEHACDCKYCKDGRQLLSDCAALTNGKEGK